MAILGTLEVRLHGGKHMKNVEFLGKNDPYAVVSYKTQDQKSKTLHGGGSDPVWNQSFFFEVDEDLADVIIKVLDEDERTADDVIGETMIPLGDVIAELAVPKQAYDLLRPSQEGKTYGEVEVSLKFVPKVSEKLHNHHQQHHNGYGNQSHHNYSGPYSEDSEGGWK